MPDMQDVISNQQGAGASGSPQNNDALAGIDTALTGGTYIVEKDWGPEYFDVEVQNRQTLEDIALQVYGATEGVLQLLMDNRDRLTGGLTTKLYYGMKLRARKGLYLDRGVVLYYSQNNIVPANGELEPPPITGPDYNDDYNDDYNT